MREIKYTVSLDGVSPSNVQFGGMQGEHNATRLNVTIDTKLFAKLEGAAYRFEAEDGAGCRQTIAMGEIESENVVCSVPQSVTCNGGNVTIRLIFSKVAETEIEYILYSFPIRLRFDLTSNGEFTESKDASDISAAVALAKGYTEKAEQAANMAENAAKTAVNARNGIEQEIAESLTNAKESGEFDGKDGVSVMHEWNGTELTVTSASGTSSADLKGEKGDKGEQGATGAQGEKGDKGDSYTLTDEDKTEIATKVNAVSYSQAQELTDEQKQMARDNIDAVSITELTGAITAANAKVVSVLPKTFTDDEKAQARNNIGAFDVSKIVTSENYKNAPKDSVCDVSAIRHILLTNTVTVSPNQPLSDREKQIGRKNIEVDGGKWELLYTIEGDGETKTWEYTQFANGSPLKLTAVSAVVIQDVAEAENSYGFLNAYCDAKSTQFPAAIYSYFTKNSAPTTSGTQRAYGVVEQYKGQYRAYSVGMVQNGNEIMRYTPYMQAKHTTADYPYIDRIKVQKQTGVFSAGNKIEVYGVKYYG